MQLKIPIRNYNDAIIDQLRSCFDVVKDLRIGFLKDEADFGPIFRLMDGVTVEKATNHSMSRESRCVSRLFDH